MPSNTPSKNRTAGKKRRDYSIRMHHGLLKDLHKAARENRRSVNAEIIMRLENSFTRVVGVGG